MGRSRIPTASRTIVCLATWWLGAAGGGLAHATAVEIPAAGSASSATVIPAWTAPGSDEFRRSVVVVTYGSASDQKTLSEKLPSLAAQLHPAECSYLKGRLAYVAGRFRETIDELRWLTHDPAFVAANPELRFYLGMALLSAKDVAASQVLLRYLERAPADSDPKLAEAARAALEKRMAPHPPPPHPNIIWSMPESEPRSPASPRYTLYDRSGLIALDDVSGRVLLLHFWASWCPPCVEELPSFVAFTESSEFASFRDRGLAPVLVTADNFMGEAEAFLDSLELKADRLYHDPDYRLITELRGELQLPLTVAVRRSDKKVLDYLDGSFDWSAPEARNWITRVLEAAGPDSHSEGG